MGQVMLNIELGVDEKKKCWKKHFLKKSQKDLNSFVKSVSNKKPLSADQMESG